MLLYHGSKSGIKGPIRPASRDRCDFGRGFYMGTDREQPLTLVCNHPGSVLYTLSLDLAPLRVLTLPANTDWALCVAYHRGKLDHARGTDLYRRISTMTDGYDVVAGVIANDRMFVVLDRFCNGDITDVALVQSLSALQLGTQYVAKTARACEAISIVDELRLDDETRAQLKVVSEANRARGIAQAEKICRRHRRDGRYFDEILARGE